MKNRYYIEQSEIGNWLFKADHHYLSSRLLYLHGLLFSAEENAGFCIELILKCACKIKGIDFYGKKHQLNKLWNIVNPPFLLDEKFNQYLLNLEKSLYNRHPDTEIWKISKEVSDNYDALDFLYLKLRKWILSLISKKYFISTEVDLAKKEENYFSNTISRHGAWSLSIILKRSNSRFDIL